MTEEVTTCGRVAPWMTVCDLPDGHREAHAWYASVGPHGSGRAINHAVVPKARRRKRKD